jgi:prepilin peptidase CpaA
VTLSPVPLSPVPVAVVVVAVVVAALTDLRSYKVHNWLTLPLLVSGLIYHGIVGGAAGLAGSACGAMIGLLLLFVFFLMGGMGGGDVKLMAGIGAWLGWHWQFTVIIFALASIAGGLYAFILMIAYGRFRETWMNFQIIWHRVTSIGRHLAAEDKIEEELKRPDRKARVVPFAAMVAIGVFVVVVGSMFMHRS